MYSKYDEKEYVSWYTWIGLREVAYARGKERSKSRMGKSAQKVQIQGPVVLKAHGISLARGIEGSWYCFGPWY